MTEDETTERAPWPLRTVMLTLMGAIFGLLFDRLTTGSQPWMWSEDPFRLALATFLAVGGVAFALSVERERWGWTIAFSVALGIVVAMVGWWNGPQAQWGAGEGWRLAAALFAAVIAVPLFQAARDEGSFRLPTQAVHSHGWTNLILWGAGLAFVLAARLLAILLSELFGLIGLDQPRQYLQQGGPAWIIAGGAFGAAIGLLRDRDNVLLILQRVVRTILSMLAPLLAAGLLLFVLAIPFTGLDELWANTKAATPVLLICVLGAVLLVNAIAGVTGDIEARSPILRWSGMALIALMTPLALIAALSTWKRIDQHGFTPDRLWAAVFVAAALAVALAYLTALIRGRTRWAGRLRRANVHLAAELSVIALILALPVVNFGAISARDQLARVESGRIPPERFDWAAMRFDFGRPGVEGLHRLAERGAPALRPHAIRWLAARNRFDMTTSTVAPPEPVPPPLDEVAPARERAPAP